MLLDDEPEISDIGMYDRATTEEGEYTPRPTKQATGHQVIELPTDDDNEPFQTPIVLSQKKRGAEKAVKRKRDQEELEIMDDGVKEERKGGALKVG
jgi:hypothetical protein